MESISADEFGRLSDGSGVRIFSLQNRSGMKAAILDYGGIVQSLTAPDRHGSYADVTLGFDSLEAYVRDSPYFGALIGRYANRIAGGAYTLEGKSYRVTANDGRNSLHGGPRGFDKVLWRVERAEVAAEGPELVLRHMSPDGDQGHPGALEVVVNYTLTNADVLRIEFGATTDNPTVVNLTGHSYFNLRGRGDILDHVLQINAARFTPVDSALIPTGEIRTVEGTPFDFRNPTAVGARLARSDEQLSNGRGYDHNWVMDEARGFLGHQATLSDPGTGRVLEVWSTEPGLQFYSGNFLDGTLLGKNGVIYPFRGGLALEPQNFPDAPNQRSFPSAELEPGETYRHIIEYRFSNLPQKSRR
jgi:aldose 1-epimerase